MYLSQKDLYLEKLNLEQSVCERANVRLILYITWIPPKSVRLQISYPLPFSFVGTQFVRKHYRCPRRSFANWICGRKSGGM